MPQQIVISSHTIALGLVYNESDPSFPMSDEPLSPCEASALAPAIQGLVMRLRAAGLKVAIDPKTLRICVGNVRAALPSAPKATGLLGRVARAIHEGVPVSVDDLRALFNENARLRRQVEHLLRRPVVVVSHPYPRPHPSPRPRSNPSQGTKPHMKLGAR